jgi:hypothetical protein
MKSKPLTVLFILVTFLSGCSLKAAEPVAVFSGESAFTFVEEQIAFGPRIPSSEGHQQERLWIEETLVDFGWDVKFHVGDYRGKPIYNIVASQPNVSANEGVFHILLGAHYDTRIYADHSRMPEDQTMPVPGANDGASGVAVLLELARVLPQFENLEIQLVFFDAEDNGYISDWDWIVGSRQFADQLSELPDEVVIVDMIGDLDQQIYFEKSSDPILRSEIWAIADEIGVNTFIPEVKHHILDDHTPFLQKGVRAVVIIDFDYPHWHTVEDTLDKVSAESLENVGIVLQEWLIWKNGVVAQDK